MTTTAIQATKANPRPRRIRAELVWTEGVHGGTWKGKLLNGRQARDQQRNDAPAVIVHRGLVVADRIHETDQYRVGISAGADGYRLLTQGQHPGSRRRTWYPTLAEAQDAGQAWARRRFWIDPTLDR